MNHLILRKTNMTVPINRATIYHIILGITLSVTIVSCSFRPYHKPEAVVPEEGRYAEESDPRLKAAEPVADWWSTFNDEDLDSLITDALDHNLNVAIAVANLRQTRALLRESGFDLFPVIRADGGYTWQRQSEEAGVPVADRNIETYDVGLNASWELDLFGRVTQAKKAAKATYQAGFAELRGTYVSVASEVALTYLQLRGAQYRLNVARQNVENQEETYQLSKALANGGSGSELDMARAEAQLELTRSSIPPLQAQIKGAINRLSVLTGRTPLTLDNWLEQAKPLPSIPPSVAIGSPADMLRRRPDIDRAERELAASVAQYNVAVADYFPRVNIFGSLGFLATSFSNLFSSGALTASVGPSISWAAFDLGRVQARVAAGDAKTELRLAIYQRTVLEALEEVSTAMSDFSLEEERRRRLTTAAQASAKAAKLAQQRYEAGIDNFLDVLDAERRLLEAQDLLAISNIKVGTDLIAIYRALGGGWQVKTETYANRK